MTTRKGHNPMSQHTEKPAAALEIWAMVNDDGEYVATHDEDNLSDLYDDCVGGTPANCRSVKLTLTVPLAARRRGDWLHPRRP